MGFYQTIRIRYGENAVGKLKLWSKNNVRMAKEYNRRIFLLQCRQNGILPEHITSTTKPIEDLLHRQDIDVNLNEYDKRLGNKLVSLEISANHKLIEVLKSNKKKLKDEIINLTNEAIFNEFSARQTIQYNRLYCKIKNKNITKLNNLKSKYTQNYLNTNPNWIKNISDTVIPDDILKFLSLGPKFSIEPVVGKDIPIKNVLADIEYIVSHFEDNDTKNILTAKVTNVITNHIHNNKSNNTFYNKMYIKTKIFLKNNPNLILTKSDKGNVTVLMSKQQYFNLCNELILQDNSYIEINKDPTLSIQNNCNKLIKVLYDTNQIDENLKKKLTNYTGVAPKFYALPKIHKPTLSIRPIVASIGAPSGLLAAFLTDILTRAYNADNNYFIKDSFQVTTLFNGMILPDNHVIASLDVVSLFSNVYYNAVHRALFNNWERISGVCNINQSTFFNLINFLFENTYFSFDNKFYKQTFGTPMGASISPILAAYVMDDLLDTVLPVLSFKPHFIKKYVDDIILALPGNGIDEIVDTLNSYDPYIQFTIEKEDQYCSVPFLDTKLIRNHENMILVDWYQKPCSSGRYLNYNSYHKKSMKVNLVKQMKDRVLKVSDRSFHKKNLDRLYTLFLENSYPKTLLRRILFNTSSTLTDEVTSNENNSAFFTTFELQDIFQSPLNHNHSNILPSSVQGGAEKRNEHTLYASLPYIKEITPKLSRILNRNEHLNIKIANKTVLRLGSINTRLKDKTPVKNLSDVIYSIPCFECDKVYVGQTSRPVSSRITSHKSDCRLHPERCALAEHVNKTGHIMNYEATKVLTTEHNYKKRLFLEMAFIAQQQATMNKRTDIHHLSEIYSYLLSLDNTPHNNDSQLNNSEIL